MPTQGRGRWAGGRRALWLGLAGSAVCLLYLGAEMALVGTDLGFPLDDSWIHLQFARNLAAGEGLAYNPGEIVTGSTAPLWTALLSVLFLLPGGTVVWTKLLGVGFYLATLHATWRLGRELELPRGLATLAVALTLATGWLVWSALSGMEVMLFTFLTLWGMVLHLRERRLAPAPPLSLLVLSVSVLARPEGALLLLLAVVDRFLRYRRRSEAGSTEAGDAEGAPEAPLEIPPPPWRPVAAGLLLGALALAGGLAFYLWAGGSPLPTTFGVKGSGLRRLLPEPEYLRVVLGILFLPHPWMTLLAPAGALVLVERLGTRRDRGLLPALWLAGLPLAYSCMSPLGPGLIAGNFGRYYFPLFPVLVVLGALGLERAARQLSPGLVIGGGGSGSSSGRAPSGSALRLPLALLLALLLLWPTVGHLFRTASLYGRNVADVQGSDVRMARFLADRLHPEALLAVNDIGAFKFFLPNPVLDVVGIASPDAQRFRQRRMAEGASFYEAVVEYLAEHRPDYLAIFPEWLPRVATDPRFEPLYVLPIPDNATMGGDRIVLFSTPWTRYPLEGPEDAERRPGDPIPVEELEPPKDRSAEWPSPPAQPAPNVPPHEPSPPTASPPPAGGEPR